MSSIGVIKDTLESTVPMIEYAVTFATANFILVFSSLIVLFTMKGFEDDGRMFFMNSQKRYKQKKLLVVATNNLLNVYELTFDAIAFELLTSVSPRIRRT